MGNTRSKSFQCRKPSSMVNLRKRFQSRHPAVQAYHDRKRFRKFTIEDGFLHWNDFDLVFPMADLYEGKIL